MNKEPQNDKGSTSTFDIFCSIFCGSKKVFNQVSGVKGKNRFIEHALFANDNHKKLKKHKGHNKPNKRNEPNKHNEPNKRNEPGQAGRRLLRL